MIDALTEEVKASALALGFVRAGVARAEALGAEAEYLRAWLARGHHGTMDWMARTAEVRADPTHAGMLPGAKSVLVLAVPYAPEEALVPAGTRSPTLPLEGGGSRGSLEGAGSGPPPPLGEGRMGRIARYAVGRDYHDVLYRRLRALAQMLRARGFLARAAVDSMPVFERAWAERAGIGFIGKNCCLIIPGLGSHVFLAAIVTTAPLEPDAPMQERCGSCRLCLDACPTRAFTSPRSLDARRCISYLTIEHRGPIDESLRAAIGDRLFGCDACQDVCPFNQGRRAGEGADPAFAPDGRFEGIDAAALLRMDEAAFARFASGSALKRTRREGLARNAALVLGNAGGRRALPVLRHAAAHDASPVVRDAAQWAVERLDGR